MAWRFLTRLSFVLIALGAIPVVLAANKKPPAAPINLNTATSDELQQVPGIGPVTAEKILQMRKAYGPFKSVDDLRAIKGIGPKRLEKMRKYLTVGKTPAAKKTPAAENISPRLNLAAPPERGSLWIPNSEFYLERSGPRLTTLRLAKSNLWPSLSTRGC